MTDLVDIKCIKCKYMVSGEVCLVEYFYEGRYMLVIHPDECIDYKGENGKNIRVISIGTLLGEAIESTALETSVSSLFD